MSTLASIRRVAPALAASVPALLSQAGTWQAEMLVRRTGLDDARTAVRFVVAGQGGAAPPVASVSGAYPLLPSPLVSLAYVLMAIGIGVGGMAVLRAVRQPRRWRALQRQAALVVAGLAMIALGACSPAPSATSAESTPFSTTAPAAARA